jgi:hypothetical protein
MKAEDLSSFNKIVFDNTEYFVVQVLAGGIAIAIVPDGTDSSVADIKVVKVE